MIKRNIGFTVAADETVNPRIPQYAGIKGEHNATLVRILMETDVYKDSDTLRLSFTTGDGSILSSDLIEDYTVADDTLCVEYLLPKLLTIGAGQLCMRVVLSKMEGDEEIVTFRSGEMVLYFDDASVENGTPFWTGVSEMLHRTVTAKDTAVSAQTTATTAAEKALGARDSAYAYTVQAREQAEAAATSAAEAKAHAVTAEEAAVTSAEKAVTAQQYATQAAQAASEAQAAVDTPGRQGASAYEVAVAQGFEGDEAAWLASLKGENGDPGAAAGIGSVKAEIVMLASDASPAAFAVATGDDTAKEFFFRFGIPGAQGGEDSEAMHYKGAVVSGTALTDIEKAVGDVYFITAEDRFYMWDGELWKPLGAGTAGADGLSAYQIWLNAGNSGTEAEFLASIKGDTYTLTDEDKQEIADICKALIEDGNGVEY